jgi:hypothetical protein
MNIYEHEKQDGLEPLIKNNTVNYCAIAKVADCLPESEPVCIVDNIPVGVTKAENKDQIDLFHLSSILVSTGWNKNDDVFDPSETWKARSTPEDKPFNYMHDEMDIIGHITANRVVGFDGNPIDDETENPPKEFSIVTNAVIYKSWSDIEQRERVNTLIDEIQEGKWFVSMECLFPNFDYALIDSQGSTKIIERSEASAFLTKHLRAYGGSGLYEDYKVGRLLRNISFSGKGLVSKPANPRSVILEGNKSFDESNSQILTVSSIKEKTMSDSNDAKVAELQSALDQAIAENKQLLERVAAEKENDYEAKLQSLETVLAEKNEEISRISDEKESLASSLKEANELSEAMKKDMEEKEEAMKEMKKKAMRMQRKAQLEEAGLDSDAAVAAVESFDSIDDAAFEAVVALYAAKQPEAQEDAQEAEAKVESEDLEVDSAEASEEVLETAETVEESIASYDDQEDPAESLRSVASDVFASVLKSTPKN